MTTEKQAKSELKSLCEKEINKSKIMIAFYTDRASKMDDEKDKEEKAKNLMKAKQLQENQDFNQELYDFIGE
jgi:hypothetical protein